MNQRYKYLLKNTGALTISNFASKILVFLLVPLYTSVLTTEEYGIYDLIVSTISLLYPLLTLNIVDAVMRYSMDKDVKKENIALIGIYYIGISTIVVAIAIFICQLGGMFKAIEGIEGLIFLFYISYVLNQYFIQLAKGLEKVSCMAVAGVLSTVVMLIGNIFFLLVFKWSLEGFLLANIMAQAIPVFYLAYKVEFIKTLKNARFERILNIQMLKYCVPLVFSTIGWWVNSASDRYVVSFICGISANGILSVAYKIPAIINTVFGMFGQAWQISAIKEYGNKDTNDFYANSFSVINFMMCFGCSVLILLSKPLAKILYAKDFYLAWQYAPFLLISTVFNTASGLIGPMLSAVKDSKAMAKSAVYGATVNVVLNIVLVYVIGVQGATIATVVAAFVIYHMRKKAIGTTLVITDYFKIVVIWGLLIFQAILEIYTKIWFLELVILLVIVIVNKELVIKCVKTLVKTKEGK